MKNISKKIEQLSVRSSKRSYIENGRIILNIEAVYTVTIGK